MSRDRDEVLLQLGYGILVYVLMYNLVMGASALLPKCREFHTINGKCVEWEKTPGQSVIQ
jgi:hypothetical protein